MPRVAVIDDDMSVRKALARLLAASSFEIETYSSARDFLRSLEGRPRPECLVVDLHMPEISGLELQRCLAGLEIKIPTIIITAYNEAGISERCKAAGAAEFLLKPINGATLIAAINGATRPPASTMPPLAS